MNTISGTNKAVVTIAESYGIVQGFPPKAGDTEASFAKGSLVTLGDDGTVTIAGPTDFPLGIVESNFRKTDDTVRVRTPFAAIVRARVSAATETGVFLAQASSDDAEDYPSKYAEVGDEQWASAVSLEDGAADDSVIPVGILRVPFKTPAAPAP
jgi:hypothetical protein